MHSTGITITQTYPGTKIKRKFNTIYTYYNKRCAQCNAEIQIETRMEI